MGVKPRSPELAEPVTALNAAQRQNVLCARFAPEHARLLAPGADHRLATGFNNPGANKEALAAEGAILHTLDIVDEVPQLLFYGLGLGFAGTLLPGLSDELLHLVVEQPPGPASEPLFVIGVLSTA